MLHKTDVTNPNLSLFLCRYVKKKKKKKTLLALLY